MLPTVITSEQESPLKKLDMKTDRQKSSTFSVIVHSGGKVKRRLTRTDFSPYFIPISNHEEKFFINDAADDNAIDYEVQQFDGDRQQIRSPSELSSSGCSSITDELCHSSPLDCRCTSSYTSDYDEEDMDDSLRSENTSPALPNQHHHRRHHHHHYQTHQCRTHRHNANKTRGLIEIAMRTIKLIRRNQELQNRLHELQQETSVFIENVMANPENQSLRNKASSDSEQTD